MRQRPASVVPHLGKCIIEMTVRSGKNAGVAGAIVRGKECQEMDRLACMTTFVAVVERGGFAPPVHRGLQSLESANS